MKMPKSATLSEVKDELAASTDRVFHSSLSLYIIAENRPRPDCPDWVEVGCLDINGAEGMMVYLSPLDALLDAQVRNRDGGRYRIYPFEALDPRPYIAEHNHWLTLYLVYGFAARGKHLLVNEQGNVQTLTLGTHFQITPDMFEHFHLAFPDSLVDELNAVHRAAGIYDYGDILNELTGRSVQDLDWQAREATECIGEPVSGDNDNVTHCALYDPTEQRWRFAAFPDITA
jgi:hypothetical protein